MLNGILNITAGSDFKNAARPGRSFKLGKTNVYHIYDGQDTINISPAYNYLAKHKWKVKELNLEDEKLLFSFELGGFSFSVSVPLKQLNQLTNVEYTVLGEKEGDETITNVVVHFLVHLFPIDHNEKQHGEVLTNLITFFNRLYYLKLNGEIAPSERKVIDSLLEGLPEKLQKEFNSINNGLFIFIEKYFNYKISGLSNKAIGNEKVYITKIRSFTQELR